MVGMVNIVILSMFSLDCPLRVLIVVRVVRFLPSSRIWSCGSMLISSVPSAVVPVWSSKNIVAMGMRHSDKVVRRCVVVHGCCTKDKVGQHTLDFRVDRVSLDLSAVAELLVRYPCRIHCGQMYCTRILSSRLGCLYSIGETNVQIACYHCGLRRNRVDS